MPNYSRLGRADIALFAGSPAAIAAFEDLQTAAFDDNPQAVAALDESKQDTSPLLDGIASLSASLGLLEQINDTDFAKRPIGVGAPEAVPDRTAADSRYARRSASGYTAPTGATSRGAFAAYVSPVISVAPTQAEVQAIADALQSVSQHVAALIIDLKATGAIS